MSLTGWNLRARARRRLLRAVNGLIHRLEPAAAPTSPEPPPAPAAPAPPVAPAPPPPTPTPVTATTPVAAPAEPPPGPAPLPPLPALPTERNPTAKVSKPKAATESPEEKQKRHWQRTRKGVLRYVSEKGGRATLRELHDHSEQTYFVAHVGFSRLMEELTGESLLDYDHDSAVATLTDAGRAALDA